MAMPCLELITKATDSPRVLDVTSRGSTISSTTAANISSQFVVSHQTCDSRRKLISLERSIERILMIVTEG